MIAFICVREREQEFAWPRWFVWVGGYVCVCLRETKESTLGLADLCGWVGVCVYFVCIITYMFTSHKFTSMYA